MMNYDFTYLVFWMWMGTPHILEPSLEWFSIAST